jgi:hypothetical protein
MSARVLETLPEAESDTRDGCRLRGGVLDAIEVKSPYALVLASARPPATFAERMEAAPCAA